MTSRVEQGSSLVAKNLDGDWHIDLIPEQTCVAGIVDARYVHLFTAAPDLLNALRKLVEWQAEVKHTVPLVYLEFARAAIAKAEGAK